MAARSTPTSEPLTTRAESTLLAAIWIRRTLSSASLAVVTASSCNWPLPTALVAIMDCCTPPGAIAIVPVAVIGPPVSPAPLVTLVTVPPELVSLSTPSANPAGTPLKPDHGAALLTAARSASGAGRIA